MWKIFFLIINFFLFSNSSVLWGIENKKNIKKSKIIKKKHKKLIKKNNILNGYFAIKFHLNSANKNEIDFENIEIKFKKPSDVNIKFCPASLTKLMTAYIILEKLESKELKLEDEIFNPDKNINMKVEQLLSSLLTLSYNKSAQLLSELASGSEIEFVKLMNEKAQNIGMIDTVFFDSSGLNYKNATTAIDMTHLVISIIQKFHKYDHFFRVPLLDIFGEINENTSDLLTYRADFDGFKTGYLAKSGYNLVSWIKNDKYVIVSILFGCKSKDERDSESLKIVESFSDIEEVV